MKLLGKLTSIIFLIVVSGLLIFLSINLDMPKNYFINKIEITGNHHLDETEYLTFAKLVDSLGSANLTMPVIHDRLLKHPFIENLQVNYDGDNVVSVKIKEKVFDAMLISGTKSYLITNKMELLPVLDNTRHLDYPLINFENFRNEKLFNKIKSKSVFGVMKLITAAQFIGGNFFEDLSEVDINSNSYMMVSLSSCDFPVVMGYDDVVSKTYYLSKINRLLNNENAKNKLKYVDLRFEDKVFLGLDGVNKEGVIRS